MSHDDRETDTSLVARVVDDEQGWPYESVYERLMAGDLLRAYDWFLQNGANLAVMPIARMHVERPLVFPSALTLYPPGVADLRQFDPSVNLADASSLSESCSAESGITADVLNRHPLIVFPCRFDWQLFRASGHEGHLEFIRGLSEEVDRACLNFVRYKFCELGRIEDLPARPGQVTSNPMMAGALLYNHALREAKIVGGAAFTHYITHGLGLTPDQIEWDSFPGQGETGRIAQHALALYTALLESESPTSRFMQALGILEFLAYPDEYQKFEKVSKVIARYVAREPTEYQRLLDRFFELTGKRDPDTNEIIGYMTRVVHMGERIEMVVPKPSDRKTLFQELDGYIRPVIDHMIRHSNKTHEEYLQQREQLRPF